MALSFIRDYNAGTDGAFPQPIQALEDLGATKARIQSDEGICHGYHHPIDGRLWAGSLVVPNAGKIAADAAAASAITADNTKTTQAINAIQAEVTRILAVAPGSRTTTEKGFLGVAWMLNKLG